MTTVCIWGAWYESANAGDQAILITISKLLKSRIPDMDLIVFSNRPEFTEEYMAHTTPITAISHPRCQPAPNGCCLQTFLVVNPIWIMGQGNQYTRKL